MLFVTGASFAQAPIAEAAPLANPTKQQLIAYTFSVASSTGVSSTQLIRTIQCESQFNPHAVSPTGDFGISQINLRYHPDIKKAQALEPYFSILWMANEFKKGHQGMWSCARRLGY